MWVALALCVATAAPAPAPAAEPNDVDLALVPLDGLGVDGALLAKLDAAVRAEVRDLGVSAAAVRPEKDCAGDVACLVAVGEKAHAVRVLAGSVGLAGDEVHLTLRLLDVGLKTELKSIDDAAPADQAERRIRATAMRLLAAEKYNTSGAIFVSSPLAGCEVVVDGVPRGTTPLFGPVDALAPGRREVEVRYPGKTSWRGFVDVGFDQPEHLDVAEKNGALVQVAHEDAVSSAGAPSPSSSAVLPLVGAGVAAVGAVGLVGAAVAYASAEDAYHRFHDQGHVSQAVLAQNGNMSVAYGILLPAGIACVAVGAGLVALSVVE